MVVPVVMAQNTPSLKAALPVLVVVAAVEVVIKTTGPLHSPEMARMREDMGVAVAVAAKAIHYSPPAEMAEAALKAHSSLTTTQQLFTETLPRHQLVQTP